MHIEMTGAPRGRGAPNPRTKGLQQNSYYYYCGAKLGFRKPLNAVFFGKARLNSGEPDSGTGYCRDQ
jgi:hypothetical protein